jgi:hypothetical protein
MCEGKETEDGKEKQIQRQKHFNRRGKREGRKDTV